MWFINILLHQVPTPLINLRLFPYYLYSLTTRCRTWLHYVHVLEVLYFSVIVPPFEVLWEYVGGRSYVELLPVLPFHSEDVSSQVVLPAQVPSPREVVYLLVLIHFFEF